MRAALAVAFACLAAGAAHAQSLVPAATLTADSAPPSVRVVGEHYVALTSFTCDGDDCHVDVANTASLRVERVRASRARLERRFGHASGAFRTLDATLVSYDGQRAGFLVMDRDAPDSSHWYGELDAQTGAVVRATKLAPWRADTDVYPIGADPAHGAVWFYTLSFDGPRRPLAHFARERSAHTFVLRRIDLADLATADVATVALPARVQAPPLEDDVFVHAAADFSKVAVVEYYEEPHRLTPPASAYVIDTASGGAFSVPIPQVVYGAVFSPDARFLYLSSAVTGDVERVDLAARAVDRTVHGPKLSHHALITPDGKHLVVLGSSKRFVAFDLPDLSHARELAHDPALAATFESLESTAITTAGALLVLPMPWRDTADGHLPDARDYAIVRIDR